MKFIMPNFPNSNAGLAWVGVGVVVQGMWVLVGTSDWEVGLGVGIILSYAY